MFSVLFEVMYDRREAPQYYPDAANRMTIHS